MSNASDPSRGHTGPTAGPSHGVNSHRGHAPHGSSPFSFQHVSSGRAYVGNLPARDYPQSKVLSKQFSSINSLPIIYYSFRHLLSLQIVVPLDNLVPGHNSTDYVTCIIKFCIMYSKTILQSVAIKCWQA